MHKDFLTLGIDTSCDETSASVVRGFTVLSNVQPSQMEFHKKYGGVVPNLARLAHAERIDNVVIEALKRAGLEMKDIDAVAVTIGPGLAIALEIGVKKAKALSVEYNKPLILINHMEGHLLSAFAERKSELKELDFETKVNDQQFPTLGFLVSGSHTELILVKNWGEYEKLGETLDDSCGEAYDKCGRILGLGYPAGPIITEFAKRQRKNMKIEIVKDNLSTSVKCTNKNTKAEYMLPIAMIRSGDLNFSYSGVKTAFKQLVEKLLNKTISHKEEIEGLYSDKSKGGLTKEQIMDLCVVFEAAALEQLKFKLRKAIQKYQPKELWLGGGVIASSRLRSEFRVICKENNIKMRFPYSKKLTGDNAAMIAVAANVKLSKISEIKHNPSENIYLKDFDQIDRDPTLSF